MAKKDIGELLASDEEVDALKPRKKLNAAGEETVTIILEDNENIPPTGQFISHNGRTWMLRSGEPAAVPLALVRILDDAVMDAPQVDPVTKQIVGYRKKLRFPYRIINVAAA
jgi:hypothetical protein